MTNQNSDTIAKCSKTTPKAVDHNWNSFLKQLIMQDLHKPNYLDAKMELGTQVQFFSFTLTQLCSYLMVLAFLTLLLLNLIPTYYTEVLSLYSGSFITMVVFYIKYGTN